MGRRDGRAGIDHARNGRAARPERAPRHRICIFNAIYGVAWFLGSVLLGVLYDRSVLALVIVAMLLQILALPVLWWLTRMKPGLGEPG